MPPKYNIGGWSLARFFQQPGPPASEHFRNQNDFRQMNADVTGTEVRKSRYFRHFRSSAKRSKYEDTGKW